MVKIWGFTQAKWRKLAWNFCVSSENQFLSTDTQCCWVTCSPVARIDFGRCRTPKVDFLNLTPFILLQKPQFWLILWLKVDLLVDLGGCHTPCTPPGYGLGHMTGILTRRSQNILSFLELLKSRIYWSVCLILSILGYSRTWRLGFCLDNWEILKRV